jgi:N-acetylglucosamine repressor
LKWNGNEKSKRTYITVLVEIDKNVSGLGIGLVIDGELYRGTTYCAGELYPHLPSLIEILGTVRSRFVESPNLNKYSSSLESIDIEFLLETAKRGDEIAKLIFTIIGTTVGRNIAPVVALLNPDTLIISGFVAELEDLMINSIKRVIEMNVLSITCKSLTISVDKYHHYSVAVGAASIILEDYFKLPNVQQ